MFQFQILKEILMSNLKSNIEDDNVQFAIASVDESRRIVFGQVYQPNRIDAKGWFMEPEEVEKMAQEIPGKIKIKEFPAGKTTLATWIQASFPNKSMIVDGDDIR